MKTKIYAKQVPPEFQDSYFDIECWPGVIIHGNRWFNDYTTPEFDAIYNRFDGEKRILRALHIVTGKKYDVVTIHGSAQSEWNNVYYPVDDYTRDAMYNLETEYFNTGAEWIINDDFSIYTYSWNTDGIRAEIASAAGVDLDNVILYTFSGWKRTPEYAEV